jgi:hypothetical protein
MIQRTFFPDYVAYSSHVHLGPSTHSIAWGRGRHKMAPMQCTKESMHVNGDSTTVFPLLDQGGTTLSKATEHCWVYWVRFVGDITQAVQQGTRLRCTWCRRVVIYRFGTDSHFPTAALSTMQREHHRLLTAILLHLR